MAVDLLVFDLDGTLVDSRRDLADSANAVLVEHGAAPLSEQAIGRMIGDGAAMLVRRAFAAADLPQPPGALARFLEIYNGRLLTFTTAYPGVDETLHSLAGRHLAVLTNKPRGATLAILEGLNLLSYFAREFVFGGDGPLPRKPDPQALLALCAAAGVSPAHTLMVGDSVVDWTTARRARTRACIAAYGFGFEGFPVGELTADDHIVHAPADVLQCL